MKGMLLLTSKYLWQTLTSRCILQPTKEVYKPDNQLQLAEKDLQEEIAKMLTANNPAAPKNTARFNMKERVYKLEPMVDQLLVHYSTDGWLLHKASEDARKQQEVEKQTEEAAARFQAEVTYDDIRLPLRACLQYVEVLHQAYAWPEHCMPYLQGCFVNILSQNTLLSSSVENLVIRPV